MIHDTLIDQGRGGRGGGQGKGDIGKSSTMTRKEAEIMVLSWFGGGRRAAGGQEDGWGGNRFNKDIGKQRLGNRVVNEWNWLSGHIIRANTLQNSKYRVGRVRADEGWRATWCGGPG